MREVKLRPQPEAMWWPETIWQLQATMGKIAAGNTKCQVTGTRLKCRSAVSWLTYDLVVNMLLGYLGNQSLRSTHTTSSQLQSVVQRVNCFQWGHGFRWALTAESVLHCISLGIKCLTKTVPLMVGTLISSELRGTIPSHDYTWSLSLVYTTLVRNNKWK